MGEIPRSSNPDPETTKPEEKLIDSIHKLLTSLQLPYGCGREDFHTSARC